LWEKERNDVSVIPSVERKKGKQPQTLLQKTRGKSRTGPRDKIRSSVSENQRQLGQQTKKRLSALLGHPRKEQVSELANLPTLGLQEHEKKRVSKEEARGTSSRG